MLPRFPLWCLLFTWALSTTTAAQDRSLSLADLHRAVMELVKSHYPKATSHVFKDKIHFEYNTRIYVLPALVKVPKGEKPPLAEERGPLDDGVYCDIRLQRGAAVTARAERTFGRGPFKELFIAPSSKSKQYHLYVVLRIPAGEKATIPDGFVAELQELLRGFDKYMKD